MCTGSCGGLVRRLFNLVTNLLNVVKYLSMDWRATEVGVCSSVIRGGYYQWRINYVFDLLSLRRAKPELPHLVVWIEF
jgi:hypothetical protein